MLYIYKGYNAVLCNLIDFIPSLHREKTTKDST